MNIPFKETPGTSFLAEHEKNYFQAFLVLSFIVETCGTFRRFYIP